VLAIGVGAMIFLAGVHQPRMVLGLLPVVGVPLPLFFVGRPSIITMLMGIGLL